MVVISLVCILLTLCEILYLLGKKCRECIGGGGPRAIRESPQFTMPATIPLTEKDTSVFKQSELKKMNMADGDGGLDKRESPAPGYSVTVS
ncbi:gap junction beta-4 protein [Oncorhynchus tshawytscha]|nr:gap junction beta-4 protein [Oncorhynchus tshawytscha]